MLEQMVPIVINVLQGIKPRPEKMIREVLQWLKENLL
jgi:hypothetical protein